MAAVLALSHLSRKFRSRSGNQNYSPDNVSNANLKKPREKRTFFKFHSLYIQSSHHDARRHTSRNH